MGDKLAGIAAPSTDDLFYYNRYQNSIGLKLCLRRGYHGVLGTSNCFSCVLEYGIVSKLSLFYATLRSLLSSLFLLVLCRNNPMELFFC